MNWMCRARYVACVVLLVLGAASAEAATHNVLVGPGVVFTPSDLTIDVGDTVVWTWAGGFHNVVSGTGAVCSNEGLSFCSGSATLVAGTTFSHTFTTEGDYPYVCVIHLAFGMVGIVRVIGAVAVPTMTPWSLATVAVLLIASGIAIVSLRSRIQRRA